MVAVQHLDPVPRHSNKLQFPCVPADQEITPVWYTPGCNLLVFHLHWHGFSGKPHRRSECYQRVCDPLHGKLA